MTFANPWSALIAAAVALPLLLLLYILKLRRHPLRIPSTLLWKQTFEDLQVNVPFQRLRTSLLFFLQLLLIVLLIFAISEPLIQVGSSPAPRMILLIDRSASMNTSVGENQTRFDEARDAVRQIIERLGRSSDAPQIMILTFGATAQVVCGFESNRRLLLAALDSIERTDEEADLDAALQLAGAFAARGEDVTDQPPDVLLISDGGVSPYNNGEGFLLRSGEFRYLQVGSTPDDVVNNLGIAAFSARRDYEDPAKVLVFARFVNAGSSTVDAVVALSADDAAPSLKRLRIPPAAQDGPGESTVTYTLDLPNGAILRLTHNHTDDLSADDEARLIIPPPERLRIALVYGENGSDPFLYDLLKAMDPEAIDETSLDEYEQHQSEEQLAGSEYDLIIFDRVSGMRLPGTPSLTVGGVPAGIDVRETQDDASMRILSWDRQHPVMRFVSLDTIVFREFGAFVLPAGATPIVFGPVGPLIAVLGTRGARHVVMGFAFANSNWPVHVSITVFMQNVIDYLTLAGSVQSGLVHQPGWPITVRPKSRVPSINIDGPIQTTLPVSNATAMTLPILRRTGLYTINGVHPPHDRLAVSMLSEQESDIRSRTTVSVNATDAGGAKVADTVPLELWPWLVGAGFIVMVLEWLFYCHRLRAMS